MNFTANVSALIRATPYKTAVTTGTHIFFADEPVREGGGDTGPSPAELMASSLASCTVITVKMYAGRKKWALDEVKVQVNMELETGTETISKFVRVITLSGNLDQEQKDRLLTVANSCPMHKLLTGKVQVETKPAV